MKSLSEFRSLLEAPFSKTQQLIESQLPADTIRLLILECVKVIRGNGGHSVENAANVLEYFEQNTERNELIEIPASNFRYGDANKERFLGSFKISQYPITNREYAEFLKANRHHPVPFVTEERARFYNWESANRSYPRGFGSFPVVLVSRFDASRYCNWIGARLPSQLEWEKAARGTQGNLYPWGNEFDQNCANTRSSHIKHTTPVNFYEGCASPYGVTDMSGNVWEWTESTETRGAALRGGSYASSPLNARCSFKNSFLPDGKSTAIGFRIAL
jgi:formylglycine-generating enzyme required for sulfatase activity